MRRAVRHLALLALLVPSLSGTALVATAVADRYDDLSGQALTDEKLREDIRSEVASRADDGTDWTGIGTIVTAIVGIGGVLLTLWKQMADGAHQRDADREAAQVADERRFDEQFNTLVTALGADQAATRVGAAVGILRFLNPQYTRFHDDLARLLVAQLKVQTDQTTRAVLLGGIEKAFRMPDLTVDDRDLAGAYLVDGDFSGLDFSKGMTIADADAHFANFSRSKLTRLIARRVNLEKANLKEADLLEARFRAANLEGADFAGANLVSASFKEANLRNTRFKGARLQGALFQGTTLTGTLFDGANVADAHFEGCNVAPETIQSLSRAVNWRGAHFDPPVADLVKAAAGALSWTCTRRT